MISASPRQRLMARKGKCRLVLLQATTRLLLLNSKNSTIAFSFYFFQVAILAADSSSIF
jgi:hypothetical protein